MTNTLTNNTVSNYHDIMKNQYLKAWKSYITQSRKLQLYYSIKTNYQIEEYLDTVRNYEQRRLLTKFRISNHKLAVETGRYGKQKIQVDKRYCILCNNSEIETEEHMLLHCPCYSSLRQHFMNKITGEIKLNTLDTKTLTVNLLSSNNPTITFYVSKYILKCFELRATLAQTTTK